MIKKLSQFNFLIQLLIAAKSQETTIKQVYVVRAFSVLKS